MAGRMRARVLARPTARGGAFRLAALGATAALLAAMLPVLVASADAAAPAGAACDHRSNNTYPKLLECVTLEGVREHQAAFQEIADDSTDPVYPGTRAAGTDGYADSVDYVAGLLEDAGYEVTLDPVEITFNFPAVLRQLTPVEAEYETGVFTGSGSGTVEGQVIPVDINLVGDRGLDERLRARRLRRPRLERRRRHRAGAARHLLLRHQGVLRRAGGRRGRHHLQPGQHARPRGPDRRGRDERGPADPGCAGTGHARHPRRRRELRRRGGPRRSRVPPPSSRCSRRRPGPTTTSSRSCPARTRTTS